MIDTLGLPLKFVFHPEDMEAYYLFDLTDVDSKGHVALWSYDISKDEIKLEDGKHQDYWTAERIAPVIRSGEWIIDFEVSDVCSPEVNDLL